MKGKNLLKYSNRSPNLSSGEPVQFWDEWPLLNSTVSKELMTFVPD